MLGKQRVQKALKPEHAQSICQPGRLCVVAAPTGAEHPGEDTRGSGPLCGGERLSDWEDFSCFQKSEASGRAFSKGEEI